MSMSMCAEARAFLLGLREFRSDITTTLATMREYDAYDKGREFAHRVTLRRYDLG